MTTNKPNFEQILLQKAKEKQQKENLAVSTAAYLANILINKPLIVFGDVIKFTLTLPFLPALNKVKQDQKERVECEALEEFRKLQAEFEQQELEAKAERLKLYIPEMQKEWQPKVNERLHQRGVKNDPHTGKFTKKTKEL